MAAIALSRGCAFYTLLHGPSMEQSQAPRHPRCERASHDRILGVDEAGRGPAMGPMVVAGVLLERERLDTLGELGVRDSKALSPTRRRELASRIVELALDVRIVAHAPPALTENLNALELGAIARLTDELAPDTLQIDAPVGPRAIPAFREQLRTSIPRSVAPIIAENKADARYPTVAAASIVAKTYRDAAIRRLHALYGDFGSGYPADPKTRQFLHEWFARHGRFPPCVRTRWRTVRSVERRARQRTLGLGNEARP